MTIDLLDIESQSKIVLRAFVNSWRHHKGPVLFVGAGLSKFEARRLDVPGTSKFGSWADLLHDLSFQLSAGDADIKRRLPTDPLRLAQCFEVQFGRAILLDFIGKHVPNSDFRPGPAHLALRALPWATIVTTNYDDLLEKTFRGSRSFRRVVTDEDLTQPRVTDDITILKLHGDLDVRSTVVFTEEDYREFEAKRPGISVKARQLLMEHPLMFVGFSLSDPNFSRIDGWIRDTVGKVRLPAIAIMHGELLAAERSMWSQRGIELVQLRDGETMERLFSALGAADRTEEATENEGSRFRKLEGELYDVVQRESEPDAVNRELARLLSELLSGSGDGDEDDRGRQIVHSFSYGWAHILKLPKLAASAEGGGGPTVAGRSASAWGVYQQLTKVTRRRVLLLAVSAGRPELALGDHRIDVVTEVRDRAEQHGFTRDDQALVYMYRARIHAAAGELKNAQELITEARNRATSASVQSRITLENRDVLFQSGDAQLIASELQRPLDQQADVHAICRRGADCLLLGRHDDAAQWYLDALNRASTGDERYVALWGRRAAMHRPRDYSSASHQRDEELRRTIAAIPNLERPSTVRAEESSDRAARAALDQKSREEIAEPLRIYLRTTRRLGMPHSPNHGSTFPLEGHVRRLAGVLLDIRSFDDDEDRQAFDALKEAIATLIRYGMAEDVAKLFKDDHSNIVLRSNGTGWFRNLFANRPTLPRQSDAWLATLLSGLPLLDDTQISFVLDEVIRLTTRAPELNINVPLEAYWKVVRDFGEHLPASSAASVLELLLNSMRAPERLRLLDPAQFPFDLWRRLGYLGEPSMTSKKIVAAVVVALQAKETQGSLQSVLTFVHTATIAKLVDPADCAELVQVLERIVEEEFAKNDDRFRLSQVAVTLLGLKPDADAMKKVTEVIVPMVGRHLRSSAAAQTLTCARKLLPTFKPEQVEALTAMLLARCEKILSEGEDFLATTAYLAAMLAALSQRDPARGEQLVTMLLRLLERFPAALFASIVGGLSINETTWVATAERALVPGPRGSRPHRLVELQVWLESSYGRLGSEIVLTGLVGLLLSDESRTRLAAVHALRGFYLAHPDAAPDARAQLIGLLARMSEFDPDWGVRCAALSALVPVARESDQPVIVPLLERVAPSTAVERRCVELLRREHGSSRIQTPAEASPSSDLLAG